MKHRQKLVLNSLQTGIVNVLCKRKYLKVCLLPHSTGRFLNASFLLLLLSLFVVLRQGSLYVALAVLEFAL